LASLIKLFPTRREFFGLLGSVSAFAASQGLVAPEIAASATPLPSPSSALPIKNRTPLAPSAFNFLPCGAVRPAGWLLEQLKIQANGLSGHLDETWPDVGPNSGWLGGTGESWERGPYFLDGLVPLAWLLDDERLKAKAMRFIDWTLDNQAPSGMFGPSTNNDWWPRIVMLKALTQYHEFTGDPRVIPAMQKYFQLQLDELPKRPLRDWGKFRWQDELLSILWLYNRTGSSSLIDLARQLHAQGHDWMAEYANFQYTQRITAEFIRLDAGNGLSDLALATHGVNNGQAVKTGPVWSLVSGSPVDRSAALKMVTELEKFHGLPNGMFSCDEHLAGLNPSQGSELCTVVEYMFSLEHALAITGEASFGDRLERLAFNALPGTFTDDMWAHQYNQEPNQIECSLHRNPWTTDGPESNLYGLEPNFGCCTANFHQGWPKFTASLFMFSAAQDRRQQDGLVAAAYAPCEVRTVLNDIAIHLVEETSYPFHGSIRIRVNPASPTRFPLKLRIPAWASGARIAINDQPVPDPAPSTFAGIDRVWRSGDQVEITFPMKPRTSRWFHDSIAIERGPLLFSYGIGESWVKLRDRGMTADWQVFPTNQWNYALAIDPDSPEMEIAVEEKEIGSVPFARRLAPVSMKVRARKVDDWRSEDGAANPPPQSPVRSTLPEEVLTLIPYAAGKLRVSAFPLLKKDP